MKTLQYLLGALALLLVVGCGLDSNEAFNDAELGVNARGAKIDVCHLDDEGNWILISVAEQAVAAHRAHGDAVDMDGDGFFDIENGCGPVDCDDTDASLTDNCCADICVFCAEEYADLFDFGDCIKEDGEGCYYWMGDYHCSYEWDYGNCYYYGCGDGTYEYYGEYAAIYDRDYYYYYYDCEDCDGDLATWHYGTWEAYWYTYCGVEYAYVGVRYEDESTYAYPDYISEYVEVTKEEALLCIETINELAAISGLTNHCEDYFPCDDGLAGGGTAGLSKKQGPEPTLHIPEGVKEIHKKLEQLRNK